MAEKQHHSEKDMKNYYKAEISRLEKELKAKDRTIFDLRNQLKCLQNKLKQPKKAAKKPANKREAAIEKAKEVRRKLAAERREE